MYSKTKNKFDIKKMRRFIHKMGNNVKHEYVRYAYFDNIKFFLMLLVVVGHFISRYITYNEFLKSIWIFIYSFHMPTFVFISGLFYKKDDCKYRIVSCLATFILLKMTMILVSNIIDKRNSFVFFGDDGIQWYIFVMAVYIFITTIFANFNLKIIFVLSLLLSLGIGFDKQIGDTLFLARMFNFYPYFILGVIIGKQRAEMILQRNDLKIAAQVLIIVFVYICLFKLKLVYILRPFFTGRNPYSATKYSNVGIILRLLCHCISIIIGFSFMFIIPKYRIPIITIFGSRTLQVYFWHNIIRIAFNNISIFREYSIFNAAFSLIFAIMLTLLLSTKFFAFPTNQVSIKKLKYNVDKMSNII